MENPTLYTFTLSLRRCSKVMAEICGHSSARKNMERALERCLAELSPLCACSLGSGDMRTVSLTLPFRPDGWFGMRAEIESAVVAAALSLQYDGTKLYSAAWGAICSGILSAAASHSETAV